MPTEVPFGMATRSSMQGAINRLAARKVTEIVAVPLFVSSHSSVIDSISYLLGLRSQQPEDLKMFAMMDNGSGGMAIDHGFMNHDSPEAMKPISSPVPIRMARATSPFFMSTQESDSALANAHISSTLYFQSSS